MCLGTALLQAINSPIPPEARRQRDALLALQRQRELTDAEQQAQAQQVDLIEMADANR